MIGAFRDIIASNLMSPLLSRDLREQGSMS